MLNMLFFRINLETGEQTVLSAHGAPVKQVVYSIEHCWFLLLSKTIFTYQSTSTPHLSIMGLHTPLPRPQKSRTGTHNPHTPRQTPLPFLDGFQTRRSHEFPTSLYLPTPRHRHASISSQRSCNRTQTLATTRILTKIHDKSCGMYAER